MTPVTKYYSAVAFALSVTWLTILYLGADYPPPVGFLWLIPLVISCGAVVFWRLPDYSDWSSQHRPYRVPRAFLEGIIAGLIIGVATLFTTYLNNASYPSAIDSTLWLFTLSIVGGINALLVYALSSFSNTFSDS